MSSDRQSALHLPQAQRRYEAVVDGILELVEARGLRAGQALPTERELGDVFGVSRNVLRQAFGVLEERGILRSVRGSGRYLRDAVSPTNGAEVASRTSMEIASIADVLEARSLLEVQVVALACERRTAQEADNLAILASRLTSWEDNLAFHTAIAAATHNFALERLVREQAELAGDLHQRQYYEDRDELDVARTEHQAVAEAIAARNSASAAELLKDHLNRTRRGLQRA